MKKLLILILISLKFTAFVEEFSGGTEKNDTKFKFLFRTEIDYERNRFFYQDIPEWAGTATLFGVDALLFHYLLEPEDKNIIKGLDISKSYAKSREIPDTYVIAAIGLTGLMIPFIPNNQGFLNYEGYINFKGFCQSLVLTLLISDILKFAIAEKRPDYKERLETGDKDIILDGRISFPSSHTSLSFAVSTYMTMFMFQYLGVNNAYMIPLKILFATGITGISVSVAVMRVMTYDHHVHDVIAGAGIGSLVSVLFYSLHNFMGIYKKKDIEKSNISLYIEPTGSELGICAGIRF